MSAGVVDRRRVDDYDEETVQPEVQGAGGPRGDPRRKDAQPVGITVQGASHADCEMEEVCAGATTGAFLGRADAHGAALRTRQRRAIRRDWAIEGGTGLAEKKSWHARLSRSGGVQIRAH